MTPAQADLARRLVALPGWEWRAGMLARSEFRTIRVQYDGEGRSHRTTEEARDALQYLGALPDLADDADRSREFYGDTLGEAVAAALVAVGRCA